MIKNFNKSKLIKINSKNFSKGGLSFIEDQHLKFKIKRIYYIYDHKTHKRGGHANKKTIDFYICINGKCKIELIFKKKRKTFLLSKKNYGLIVYPGIFKIISKLTKNTVLMSICSTNYLANDNIIKK